MINTNTEALLAQLADRLRKVRLARNESQEAYGARIGLTRQTYSKMEKGVASVPIAYWLAASEILGRLQSWHEVLAEKEDLLAPIEQKPEKRQRASSKRARK